MTNSENSKSSICLVYQRNVVNPRETLDVMCLVQKHLCGEQIFNNVEKGKANQSVGVTIPGCVQEIHRRGTSGHCLVGMVDCWTR